MNTGFDWIGWSAYGGFDLRTKQVQKELLEAMESSVILKAKTWSSHDGGARIPYTYDDVASAMDRGAPEFEAYFFGLGQGGSATVSVSRWPRVTAGCSGGVTAEETCAWCITIDSVTRVLKPDISVVTIGLRLPSLESGQPTWDSQQQKTEICMEYSMPAYNDYYRIGPRGLGTRTTFGPHYIEQFGRSLLLTTPVHVTELDWGGVQLDLVEAPWNASMQDLAAAWRRGMEHLTPAGIFAELKIDEERKRIRYVKKGPNVVIGGVLPKEP